MEKIYTMVKSKQETNAKKSIPITNDVIELTSDNKNTNTSVQQKCCNM